MGRRLACPVTVGRARENEVLDRAWAEAQAGAARAVVVCGVAGVGKTRLVDEFVRSHDSIPTVVLSGRCSPGAAGRLPFAPFREALGMLQARLDSDALRALLSDQPPWVSALVQSDLPTVAIVGDSQDQLIDAGTRLLARVARDRPVLLWLEDLHWADAASRDMLDLLCRALTALPLLTVATFRLEDDPGDESAAPRARLLDELIRLPSVERLDIEPLGPDDVARQIRGIIGSPPPVAMLERVVARSGGNPFLVEELTAGEREGRTDVPAGTADLLLRRTRGLPATADALLRAAAVHAAPVTEAELAQVCELPEPEVTAGLRCLADAQLLGRVTGGRLLDFRHALLREAVSDDLLPGEARGLHRRWAQVAEASHVTSGDPRQRLLAAHHWWAAQEPDRAFPAALAAAEAARGMLAFDEELRLLTRADQLWDQLIEQGADPVTDRYPDRAALRYRAAGAAARSGDLETSCRLYDAAIAEVGVEKDPRRAATYLRSAGALVEAYGALPHLAPQLRRVLELLAPEDAAARASALRGLTYVDEGLRYGPRSRALRSEAVAAAEASGDRALVADMRIVHADLLGLTGPDGIETALQLYASARATAAECGRHRLEAKAMLNHGGFLVELARHAESAALLREALAFITTHPVGLIYRDWAVGDLMTPLLALGAWDEADALLDDALLVDRPSRSRGVLLLGQSRVRRYRGDLEGSAASLASAVRMLPPAPQGVRHQETARELTVAELLVARSELDAAYTTARDAYHADPDNGDQWLLMPLLHAAARAAAGRMRAEETEWVLTAAQRQTALRPYARWWPVVIDATLHPDPDRWQAAANALVPGQAPVYLRMTTYLSAARALVGAGNRADAAELLAQAAELATRHGARTVLVDAEQLARHARLPLPGQPGPDSAPPKAKGLPSRKLEVLETSAPFEPRLKVPVGPPEARIRTFLIADVRGYTTFTAARGDEAAGALAARFAEVTRAVVAEHSGRLVELRGDEALVVFNSARSAIRTALALQNRFITETLADPALPLPVGIGLDAGEAVEVEEGYRGGALNLAARLCSAAAPGEVLASREVTHLARHIEGVQYVQRESVQFKGLAEPVPVMRVELVNSPV